jgi:restriction endonuclease Mrr
MQTLRAKNKIGGPAIRVYGAWRGYFVTTSGFTRDALESAESTTGLSLVDMNALLAWQLQPPYFVNL